MAVDLASSRSYIEGIDLSGTRREPIPQGPGDEARGVFEDAKTQAQVVGSGVFSFEQGVTAAVREAISDSALLAQLVANKRTPVEVDPKAWFRTYMEVLQHVGWTVQEGGWVDYTARGTGAEVHEKILEVATAALAPTVGALAIIAASVKALKGLEPDSPWLTLFDRESKKARIARFQVGLVSTDPQGDVFVSMIVCLVEAQTDVTQVLLFKFRDASASFSANSGKVSVNMASVIDLRDEVRRKTRAYQRDYVSGILDL
jgi:hypothetical protein